MVKDDELLEEELDEELMNAFSAKIEKAINSVIKDHTLKDPRVELLTILLSFGAQVSQDMGVTVENFCELASTIYEESKDSEDENEIEKLPAIKSKQKNNKLN